MEPEPVKCPKCGSTQIHADKKGFSNREAVKGALLFGGVGLIAGNRGANQIVITCLKCGTEFLPGARPVSPSVEIPPPKSLTADEQDAIKNQPTTNVAVWIFAIVALFTILIFFIMNRRTEVDKKVIKSSSPSLGPTELPKFVYSSALLNDFHVDTLVFNLLEKSVRKKITKIRWKEMTDKVVKLYDTTHFAPGEKEIWRGHQRLCARDFQNGVWIDTNVK